MPGRCTCRGSVGSAMSKPFCTGYWPTGVAYAPAPCKAAVTRWTRPGTGGNGIAQQAAHCFCAESGTLRRTPVYVELRALDSIRPYENNPRVNDPAVDAVAASIKEFGFRQPI